MFTEYDKTGTAPEGATDTKRQLPLVACWAWSLAMASMGLMAGACWLVIVPALVRFFDARSGGFMAGEPLPAYSVMVLKVRLVGPIVLLLLTVGGIAAVWTLRDHRGRIIAIVTVLLQFLAICLVAVSFVTPFMRYMSTLGG